MASPSPRSTTSSSSTPVKLPPSGPRALRALNGAPPAGPSGFSPRDKISFAIPVKPNTGPTKPAIAALESFGSKEPIPALSTSSSHGHTNGFSSTHAESSRHAIQAQAQRYGGTSAGRSDGSQLRSQTASSSYASSSSTSSRDHDADPKDRSKPRRSSSSRKESSHRRSPSPTRKARLYSPPERDSSHRKEAESDGNDYRNVMLPTSDKFRAPISIALPGLANGLARARPPHLDTSLFERNVAGPSRQPVHRKPSPPPSPPRHRPPTPPPPDERYPLPPDDRPPTPPPFTRPPSPLLPLGFAPSPPLSPPPDPPSPPQKVAVPAAISPSLRLSTSRSPSPPPVAPSSPPKENNTALHATSLPAPPSFHFRELPLHRKSLTPEEDSEQTSASSSVLGDPPERPPTPVPVEPPAPPRSPTPPYVPTTYVPPPSTRRRPGLGNYLVVHVSASLHPRKEVVKRYDGGEGDDIVKVSDPRLEMLSDVRLKGRGSAKQRVTFHELEYEWDEYSTGPKPPPPPSAVLITGLNPLTTVDQITNFLRPHGRIRDIDPKMDVRSGMQLGICWVKFDGPLPGRPGTGHDVANQVLKVCDGQRVGLLAVDERIKVVLDGRGLRMEKAVKEEMARRYPPKKVEPPKQMPPPAVMTPSSGSGTPRRETVPSVPKPLPASLSVRPTRPPIYFNIVERNRSQPTRSFAPLSHTSLPQRPAAGVQQLSSSFVDAPFAHHAHPHHGKHDEYRDSYSRRGRSRSRSYSRCSTCSSSSESEEDGPAYRRRSRSPYGGMRGRGRGPAIGSRKEDVEAVERVKKVLAEYGRTYVFIDANSLPPKSVSEEDLKEHFRAFKPSQVLSNYQGWYILFTDDTVAQRVAFLDGTIVRGGHRLVINVRTPPTVKKPVPEAGPTAGATETKVEKGWRFLTFTKRNRPTPQRKASPKEVDDRRRVRPRRRSFSSTSSEDESLRRTTRKPSISSASELSEDEMVIAPPRSKPYTASLDEASLVVQPSDEPMPFDEGEPELEEVFNPSKKRPAKPKAAKGNKKARFPSPVLEIEVPIPAQVVLEVAEIKIDVARGKPVKQVKPKKAPQDAVDKLLASSELVDEEDAYWLGQALEASRDGFEPDFSDDEDELLDEKHPLYHTAGAWRAEGWRKVPQIQKSSYLPQRNRAAVSAEDAGALTSGRTARVTGRRLALDMETHRKTAASSTAESDLFAFNQLRIRKKQLRFARSAIEGYGLYAMESITGGEMVCEYVGEICRSAVAEVREQRYLKQGIGSSYLFRIDADAVCDATFRGSVSRLINHSCDPSASAKIISINGHSKIVIYAKRNLHPGEEILYDYKFPLESDPALRVPCLCGAATCRGWLN